jgi:proline iminopeptidase
MGNPAVWRHFVTGEQQTMDLECELGHARCRVLVLAGELDPVFPIEASDAVVSALPAGLVTYERLDGASHRETMSGPEATAMIRSFILST